MTYALFLSHDQNPTTQEGWPDWVIARSVAEARDVVRRLGLPSFLSIQTELGDTQRVKKDKNTGLTFAQWFSNYVVRNPELVLADFDYVIVNNMTTDLRESKIDETMMELAEYMEERVKIGARPKVRMQVSHKVPKNAPKVRGNREAEYARRKIERANRTSPFQS